MEKVYKIVGKAIREKRKYFFLTQQDLSKLLRKKKIFLDRTSINKIESGKQRVLLHDFIGIFKLLNIECSKCGRVVK